MKDLQQQTVKVEIGPDGTMTYSVEGVKGESCTDLTAFLDDMGDAAQLCKTDEFYETSEVEDQLTLGTE